MEQIKTIIGYCGYAVEIAGVIVILAGFIFSVYQYVRSYKSNTADQSYKTFRKNLGRSILLGLEFLIAGDIIRTVIVSASIQNIGVLALIILIRTFLGITLHLEIEGRWPWQESKKK